MIITAHRLRVVEAALFLSFLPIAQLFVPWRYLLKLGGARIESPPAHTAPACDPTARSVGWAVSVAARRLPWRPLCLSQATVAALMLRLRGRRSVLCLGVREGGDGLRAHAWLLMRGEGGGVVSGGEGIGNISPLRQLTKESGNA